MAQIFPRSANWVARASVILGLVAITALLALLLNLHRTDFVTGVSVPLEQPVPFSHKHHVSGLGIDCRYCHTSVEVSAFAGIPPTETCMTCHSQIWTEAPMLEPVRASFRNGVPLQWARVHDLPDFVYFDHSIHVNRGVGCQTCHGQVDQMPLIWQASTLNMEWCLGCHRDPVPYLRPPEQVYSMTWRPPPDQREQGKRLVQEYGIQVRQLTDCSVCHR
ncbi:MAG: cytochrome c3 family protein [Candidatus Latescibacterota bacterium]